MAGESKNVDLYLLPAPSLKAGTSAYYELTGAVAMMPRYAFGFMACRWGWKDDQYIWDMLESFRNGSFPIDAWISDFEWFTKTPDYQLPDQGNPDYHDFSYNPITFPHPQQQLQDYRQKLNLRFGGIRKPRLGNSDLLVMARANDWTIQSSRNLNYSREDVMEWYGKQQAGYLTDGVEFFWNDEGETMYYTFHNWNVAEIRTLDAQAPSKRFWSINRAFSPGMQRLGAMTWTGDIAASWDDLLNTPGMMLNWALAGSPIVTCDIGGFNGNTNPLLLSRWYQARYPYLYPSDALPSARTLAPLRRRASSCP